jgi:hypothetical protein
LAGCEEPSCYGEIDEVGWRTSGASGPSSGRFGEAGASRLLRVFLRCVQICTQPGHQQGEEGRADDVYNCGQWVGEEPPAVRHEHGSGGEGHESCGAARGRHQAQRDKGRWYRPAGGVAKRRSAVCIGHGHDNAARRGRPNREIGPFGVVPLVGCDVVLLVLRLQFRMRLVSHAHIAISTRFRAPSLHMRLARWLLTVLRLMCSSRAILLFVRPRATGWSRSIGTPS